MSQYRQYKVRATSNGSSLKQSYAVSSQRVMSETRLSKRILGHGLLASFGGGAATSYNDQC